MLLSQITLYEIGAKDGRSVSPFVWRIKLALAWKGLAYGSKAVGLSDVRSLFEGRFLTCPILDFGDRQFNESLVIADQLDALYLELPPIFSCPAERALISFFDQWLTQVIVAAVLPVYTLDAYNNLSAHDREYYRQSREEYFGRTLEDVVADRQERLADLRYAFDPVRKTLAGQAFVGGNAPNFADMSLLGLFVFIGSIGTLPLFTADDPLLGLRRSGIFRVPLGDLLAQPQSQRTAVAGCPRAPGRGAAGIAHAACC